MTSNYSGSFTNYSLSNPVYTNESGSSYFTWTVPYHLTITSFIMNVSGQTNGGGWGIFYATLGPSSILKGDEYYPAAPATLTELSIPISAFSKVTFNKGDAIQFKWSTLEASGRPFLSRYLDNPPYTPPSNIDLPIKITYTYTQSAYTVGTYTYYVPSGVSSINIKAWGAGGSGLSASFYDSNGGNAAMVEGNLAVTPGQVLTIDVAGGGALPTGGYVGGGNGNGSGAVAGAGGGGCTIIKNSANTNLVMVGGGGGAGYQCNGGYGGITNGQNGGSAGGSGFGGTQSSGGAGGTGPNGNGGTGGAGTGGNGGTNNAYLAGGGSGYYGGGGGALGGTGNGAGAGGGGSSFYTNLTDFVGYAWDGDSTHQFANIPNYGQPAGTGVGGVSSDVSINSVGGNGYVIISPGSAGICFRDSTRVLMADRTFKAIKDIERGDEILTDKKNGATKKVARSLKYMATGKATEIPMHLIGNRRTIVCSSTHPFWVSDTRRILAGHIEGTETIQICEWLYTIQFEDEGTYYVEGVKVDAVSPDHRKFKLPKELYFDQSKFKANRVMKSEDDERRKKPKMVKTL